MNGNDYGLRDIVEGQDGLLKVTVVELKANFTIPIKILVE